MSKQIDAIPRFESAIVNVNGQLCCQAIQTSKVNRGIGGPAGRNFKVVRMTIWQHHSQAKQFTNYNSLFAQDYFVYSFLIISRIQIPVYSPISLLLDLDVINNTVTVSTGTLTSEQRGVSLNGYFRKERLQPPTGQGIFNTLIRHLIPLMAYNFSNWMHWKIVSKVLEADRAAASYGEPAGPTIRLIRSKILKDARLDRFSTSESIVAIGKSACLEDLSWIKISWNWKRKLELLDWNIGVTGFRKDCRASTAAQNHSCPHTHSPISKQQCPGP